MNLSIGAVGGFCLSFFAISSFPMAFGFQQSTASIAALAGLRPRRMPRDAIPKTSCSKVYAVLYGNIRKIPACSGGAANGFPELFEVCFRESQRNGWPGNVSTAAPYIRFQTGSPSTIGHSPLRGGASPSGRPFTHPVNSSANNRWDDSQRWRLLLYRTQRHARATVVTTSAGAACCGSLRPWSRSRRG